MLTTAQHLANFTVQYHVNQLFRLSTDVGRARHGSRIRVCDKENVVARATKKAPTAFANWRKAAQQRKLHRSETQETNE